MRIPKLKLGDMVEVTWEDATGEASWFALRDFKWPKDKCRTIGYYLKHNKRTLALVNSLFNDFKKSEGTLGGLNTIPMGMVLRIRKL